MNSKSIDSCSLRPERLFESHNNECIVSSTYAGPHHATISLAPGYSSYTAYSNITSLLTALTSNNTQRSTIQDPTSSTAESLLKELDTFKKQARSLSSEPSLPSTDYVLRLMAFLAEDDTGTALKAKSTEIASLFIPGNKTELCSYYSNGRWSDQVSECYCSNTTSIIHCEALSFIELSSLINTVDASQHPLKSMPDRMPDSSIHPRQVGVCKVMTDLISLPTTFASGCVARADCTAIFYGIISVRGAVEAGCYPRLQLSSVAQTAMQTFTRFAIDGFQLTGEFVVRELSTLLRGSLNWVLDIGVGLRADACIGVPFLQEIMKKLQINVCVGTVSNIMPLKSQIALDVYAGNVQYALVGVKGTMQYLKGAYNPVCELRNIDSLYVLLRSSSSFVFITIASIHPLTLPRFLTSHVYVYCLQLVISKLLCVEVWRWGFISICPCPYLCI